ncbi:MAG: hypothetical protein H7144_03815, partial [Burkholderiales bacterium]|nr:hypothetical protein [Phycisphaerae bacterium]
MKYQLTALLVSLLVVPAMSQERRSDDYSEKYGVLSDKNIFLKDRPRPRPPSTARTERTERPPVPEEPLENRFILRGVVIEDSELRAYVENTRTNFISRLVPGDSIARGHVLEIGIDAIRYEQDGRIKWVEIGHNLAGARQMDVPRVSTPTPAV